MPEDKIHLVVLHHGLWGTRGHVTALKEEIEKAFAESTKGYTLRVLLPKGNESLHTYDGFDYCAERALQEIDAEVAKIKSEGNILARFSIVGYSLGGLIARYIVGLLHSRRRSFFEDVEPGVFGLIASPNLGIPRYRGSFAALTHWGGSRLLSRTGRQLYGTDRFFHDKPLLEVMADPRYVFYQALQLFKKVELYGNIAKDMNVRVTTGLLEAHDPFAEAFIRAKKARKAANVAEGAPLTNLQEGGIELTFDPDCPPIVKSWKVCEAVPPSDDLPRAESKGIELPKQLRPSAYPWWSRNTALIFIILMPISMPFWLALTATRFALQSRASGKRILALRKEHDFANKAAQLKRVGLKEVADEMTEEVMEDGGVETAPHDAVLSPAQQRIIKHILELPNLTRHFVYCQTNWNAHASIIVRDPSAFPLHEEGRPILQHLARTIRDA